MIRNSFIFLDKVSNKKERNIWRQGIRDWSDFLKIKNVKGISARSKSFYDMLKQKKCASKDKHNGN